MDAEKDGFDKAFSTIRKAYTDMRAAQVEMERLVDRGAAGYEKISSQLIGNGRAGR